MPEKFEAISKKVVFPNRIGARSWHGEACLDDSCFTVVSQMQIDLFSLILLNKTLYVHIYTALEFILFLNTDFFLS